MSYSKQLKKQQKKKAREKSVKKETTKVQNKSSKKSTHTAVADKYLEKLQTSLHSSLAELDPDIFIEKFCDQYRLNLINGLAKNHYTENIEAYYSEGVLTNNIKIFNNFVYEGNFFNIDMIKNSVRTSGMDSLSVLLSEVFGATQAFLLMPHVVRVNKKENRDDINEKYITMLNNQLSSYLKEKLTLDTLEEFMDNIASKLPKIYDYAIANTPKNEQDLKKINERYSNDNDLNEDLDITNKLANNNRNKYKKMVKDFHNNMINVYPKAVNTFREKYLTNNYDLKFDIYSNVLNEKETIEFIEDFSRFLIANMNAEEESTNMKLLYYYEGNRNLLNEVSRELGIKLEEFIQKCEADIKNDIRAYVMPYGNLENMFTKVEHVDKLTWYPFRENGEMIANKLDRENLLDTLLEDRDFFIEIYNALLKDLFSLKRIENKLSFEDILKNEISIKVEDINYNIINEYNNNILNNPNFEIDFNFDFDKFAEEIVDNVKESKIRIRNDDYSEKDKYITFEKHFAKKDFEKLLKKKVADQLKTYLDSFKKTHTYYKNKIENNENVAERVCENMRLNLLKNHGKYNDPDNNKSRLSFSFDYYDLEGFKADYEKVLELLNISKDSEEFKKVDLVISTNIKAIEKYNGTTAEDRQEDRMKNVRNILAKGSKNYS